MKTSELIDRAFVLTNQIPVNGNGVDAMHLLRETLREAFRCAKELEQNYETEVREE